MLEDFKLKVFMTVAAERSFTKAATVLGISQPAVSQNISELEKSMDIRLFNRLRGEVAITPQGQIFHAHATEILASYERMNRLFCNPRINGRTIPVRLYISPVLSSLLTDGLISTLTILQPSLKIEPADTVAAAHVSIIGIPEKKDADFSIKVSVLSDDILLQAFFRQLVDYCL